MARLPRVCPVGIPQHVIQRGNNRQVCFASEQDFAVYANWLKAYAKEFQVDLHAWVLMTNHVHLLCTPRVENAVSRLMQALGRQYVRYFNFSYKRTGTLWEGRFKSCLVQQEAYLLQLYRYIELNPVRAGIVNNPENYLWSSYHYNALGKSDPLISPHAEYLSLGNTPEKRQQAYRCLYENSIPQNTVDSIRDSTNKAWVLGGESFKHNIEAILNRRLEAVAKGGDHKSWQYKENRKINRV